MKNSKRGFTLLELIIVIIIIGVLATLGFTQYVTIIEKARGAEARQVLGDIRKKAAAFRLEYGSLTPPVAVHAGGTFVPADADINAVAGNIPVNCTQSSHYFSYNVVVAADPVVTITATRCAGATGKNPGGVGTGGQTLILVSNLATGTDQWGGTGPWD